MAAMVWRSLSGAWGAGGAAFAVIVLLTSEVRRVQGRPRPLHLDLATIAASIMLIGIAFIRPVLS